jgi:parallel beta-helix repeat protein
MTHQILGRDTSTVAQADYYVATPGDGGSDSNPGTLLSPFATIQKAADVATAGKTVMIRSGSYAARVLFNTNAGTSGNPITFRNYPGETPIIEGTSVTVPNWGGLVEISKSYITLDTLTVRNSTGEGIAIQSAALHITLTNLTVHNNGSAGVSGSEAGIYFNGHTSASYSVVRGCTIYDNYRSGIALWGSTGGYFLIEDNVVHGNVGTSNWDGIQNTDAPYTIIRNNICYANGAGGGEIIDGGGSAVDNGHHVIWQGNTLYLGGGTVAGGIKMTGYCRRSMWRFNKVYDLFFQAYGQDFTDVVVYHNTIVGNSHGIMLYNEFTTTEWLGMSFVNNLILTSSSYLVYVWGPDDTVSAAWPDLKFDYNLYKFSGGGLEIKHLAASTNYAGTEAGVDSWRAARGQEPSVTTSVTTAALTSIVTDPANLDFTLPGGSPAIDAGTPLARTVGGGTSSTSVTVDDSKWFTDGFGLVTGDVITVGGVSVTITAIDEGTDVLTVTPAISWSDNDPVSFAYSGSAPDCGALQA